MLILHHNMNMPLGYDVDEYREMVKLSIKTYSEAIRRPSVDVISVMEPMPREELGGLAEIIEAITASGELEEISEINFDEDTMYIK